MKLERSVFSKNGSLATSLTNITKSKLETKENTIESKEMIKLKLKEKGVNKRNLKIQVNNQNNSQRSRILPNLFIDDRISPR